MQVTCAVRLAMQHVGPLERHGGELRRVWKGSDEEYDALCGEMLALADVLRPAPKRLLEVRPLPAACFLFTLQLWTSCP